MKTKSKKIIFFTSSIRGGGAEKQLLNYFEILNDNFDCKYYVARDKSEDNILGLNRKKTIYAFFDIVKIILKEKPNFLITTLPTPNLINALISKLKLFEYESIVRIANHNIDLRFTKFIIKNANKVIFNSIENLNLYAKEFPNSKNFYYVNNIVNKSIDKLHLPNSKKMTNAIVVARLTKNKGLDVLIDATNQMTDQEINVDIYGVGPELENLKNISINKNVKFINEFTDLNKIWKNYNLFILPSKKEGMSNVLLEAQYNNLFSIVSDCKTGNTEIINLTNNGIIFKNDNSLDLKIKILNFLNSKYKIVESRKIIENNFSRQHGRANLLKVLNIFD